MRKSFFQAWNAWTNIFVVLELVCLKFSVKQTVMDIQKIIIYFLAIIYSSSEVRGGKIFRQKTLENIRPRR